MWATGNGGHYDDHCSCDGYITSIFTVSIGAVNDRGKSPWYAEPCPSTLAVTYSSGETQGRQDKQIVTTDLHHSCTKSHTGTSAAAPLAAGLSLSDYTLVSYRAVFLSQNSKPCLHAFVNEEGYSDGVYMEE